MLMTATNMESKLNLVIKNKVWHVSGISESSSKSDIWPISFVGNNVGKIGEDSSIKLGRCKPNYGNISFNELHHVPAG
jgi:hypothetical protein